MAEIIEYVTQNYIWFLGGMIVILLAIIGSYADKTNFGQKKIKSKKEKTNTTPAIFSYIVNFCINRKHQPEEFMPNKK